jgi:uncharacterized protein (DUF1330 family)
VTAYVISLIRRVHDRKRLEAYWAAVGPTFEGTGARPISVYQPFEQLEGDRPVEGAVLVEFPSLEAIRTWYFGEPYQAVKPLRDGGADIDIVIADGGVTTALEERMPRTIMS